jgi:hypothetical protein
MFGGWVNFFLEGDRSIKQVFGRGPYNIFFKLQNYFFL